MELKLESREGYLLATAAGRVSLNEAVAFGENICDAAAERGFAKILLDCFAVEGELTVTERFILGKTIAEHCAIRSMNHKVAVIGNPIMVTGLGAKVAWNRGLNVQTFPELQAALAWLEGFGTKATAS